jgi:hypothetical protein
MNLLTLLRLALAAAYAVLPYLCLLLALPASAHGKALPRRGLLADLVSAAALFCAAATTVSVFSFDFYRALHSVLLAVAVPLAAWRAWRSADASAPAPVRRDAMVWFLIAAAFLVRFLPVFFSTEALGGDDARFHNVLAQKILLQRSLPAAWYPFASIPVTYPLGSHATAAFLADVAQCPVHHAVSFLIVLVGALSVGMIFLLAREVFQSADSALFAAVCYGFMASWGSLDYYRWGGLPNALAMLFLCSLALRFVASDPAGETRILGSVLAGLEILAIALTHPYTAAVAALLLVSCAWFAVRRRARAAVLAAAGIGVLFCAPHLAVILVGRGGGLAYTSAFVFREPALTILDLVAGMGPGLVAAFAVAVGTAWRKSWTPAQLALLGWFAGLFAAFVLLEYGYRAASLLLTSGRDMFTALTPSRLATDMVYPMSILCGFLPASPLWVSRRRAIALLAALAAAIACTAAWWRQTGVGPSLEQRRAAAWIRENTPAHCLLAGGFPHLEYLAWRETATPPLPATEQRKHPSVAWKTTLRTAGDWLAWERKTERPVFFVAPYGTPRSALLERTYANLEIEILARPAPR